MFQRPQKWAGHLKCHELMSVNPCIFAGKKIFSIWWGPEAMRSLRHTKSLMQRGFEFQFVSCKYVDNKSLRWRTQRKRGSSNYSAVTEKKIIIRIILKIKESWNPKKLFFLNCNMAECMTEKQVFGPTLRPQAILAHKIWRWWRNIGYEFWFGPDCEF